MFAVDRARGHGLLSLADSCHETAGLPSALGRTHPRIEAVAWTADEWRAHRRQRNPLAAEAVERGVWLVGSAESLDAG